MLTSLFTLILALTTATTPAPSAPNTNSTMPTGTAALDIAAYPPAPPALQLAQVHVYVRHGERTPVGIRMSAPPASIPEHWLLCASARRFRAAHASHPPHAGEEGRDLRRAVERADGRSVEGECLLGELTDVGRESTYNYGLALRKLYIDKLGFLPDSLANDREVYFRSTNMPRTIETLQEIIHGLYPADHRTDASPAMFIRNGKDEDLLGNTYACKRLEVLQVGFAQAAAAAWNHTLEPLDKKISKYLDGNPIRLDGKPRASGVLDTVRAATAHGIKVPPEFEEKGVIDTIEKAVVTEWFAGYKTEEVRRLGMGRLLGDLSRRMGQRDALKLAVYSTHDVTLAALCSTLDVYDEKWPAFTGSITFELFRKEEDTEPAGQSFVQTVFSAFGATGPSAPTGQHYVRMRYQNRNMVLPLCAEEGRHLPGAPEFCTLAAFRERVKELTPEDWEGECAAR